MRKFAPLLGIALAFTAPGSLQAQAYTPIGVTGFNHDVFAESGSNATLLTDTVLDATNHIMYTQAFAAAQGLGGGLPDNGLITDASNTYQFQLANFTGPNALTLVRNRSLDLGLTSPGSYARLSLLAFSAEGASSISVTANFSSGPSVLLLANYSVSDWFFATGNVVTSGFGRIARLTAPPYTADGLPNDPRFYKIDLTMPCADQQRILSSLTITNTTTTGSNAPFPNTAILAVSGVPLLQTVTTGIVGATCGLANGSATVNVFGNSGPYTMVWTTTNPVVTGPTATGLTEGTGYPVTITNGYGCSSQHWVVLPNSGPSPGAIATASPASICSGASSQLSVSLASGSIASVTWTPGALTGSSVTVSPAATTSYVASGTNASGCPFSASVTVNVTPSTPPPAPAAAGATICAGNSTTLTVQNPNILYTYNWYSTVSGGTTLATGLNYTTPALAGSQTYYLEAAFPCAASPRTAVSVTVTSVPPATVMIGGSVCAGRSATLAVAAPVAGLSYNWYDALTGGTLLSTGNGYTTPPLSATTTYYVEASNGTCSSGSRAPVTATVIALPAAPSAPPASTCAGSSATLFVQAPDPSLTYSWYTAATGGAPLSSNPSYSTPALTANTTYYVEAVTVGGSCPSATRSAVPVTVIPAPTMPGAADVSTCPNTPAVLSVQNPQTGVTYDWYTAPNAGTLLFTGPVFTTPNLTTSVTYYLEARIGTCIMGRPPVTVTIDVPLPAPLVTGIATSTTATFSWTAVPGAIGYEVSLNGGATWATPSSGATGTTHVVSNLAPGQSVTLQVRALATPACRRSAPSAPVTVGSTIDDVFVPNVFTPNNDGRNDDLLVYGSAIASMDFRVFDQWGNEIFRSADKSKGWDGTYRGQRAPVGVYVFALRAVLTDGTVVSKKGSVNLLR